MKRMAAKFVVLLVAGFVGLGVLSACASEDTQATFKQDGGSCKASFCAFPAGAVGCCLTGNACGVNFNNTGCVPWKKDGGSQ
ncbi:MAG TPA: hypothetical protein VH062_10910 [Polyangiaceae bacterium]|jgi:hypothetical protein|nr:hypothetical protein [Polyangiaceae bacterium]